MVIQTLDGKTHPALSYDDVMCIVEEYCGSEVRNTLDEMIVLDREDVSDELDGLKQEFESYESSLDHLNGLMYDVCSLLEQTIVEEIEDKKRINKSSLTKRLMDIDDMIVKEL